MGCEKAMIITKTPFRISFFGGGTDYPVWYREHGGAVLSTAINHYSYISTRYLSPFFPYKFQIRYRKQEETKTVSEIQHPSVRECLKFMDIQRGIEMVYASDIPALSGVGSSSAFTVGFLHSLYALTGKKVSKKQLALDAIHVEQDLIGERVGSQDQVAVAIGGLNQIDFSGEHDIDIKPLAIDQKKLQFLQDHLMLFFTGFSRRASDIAQEQIKQTPKKTHELQKMQGMVAEAVDILKGNTACLDDFGKLLHESWKLKRSLTHLISTDTIDTMYETALQAGALGGKLCGAGGGGFLLLFAHPETHSRIKEQLGLLHVPFSFESLGSQIIFDAQQNTV